MSPCRCTTTSPKVSVTAPLYYIVPPQWKGVIEVLEAHGLTVKRTTAAAVFEIESYRFIDVSLPPATFEGRTMPSFQVQSTQEQRVFPAGSAVVSLAQSGAPVAMHLLEPQAPDSFVAWGFFNAIFEQKEYSEDYVTEKLARDMMAEDPSLRTEFEKRLASDSEFAASPRARLQFFYQRSPYWDPELNLYPVGRIVTPLEVPLR